MLAGPLVIAIGHPGYRAIDGARGSNQPQRPIVLPFREEKTGIPLTIIYSNIRLCPNYALPDARDVDHGGIRKRPIYVVSESNDFCLPIANGPIRLPGTRTS